MSDMTGAVTHKFHETKQRVTKASEGVLVSRPVQSYFDLLEFVLRTAGNTLDKVLPPGDEGKYIYFLKITFTFTNYYIITFNRS
jgi:hypothetical protein